MVSVVQINPVAVYGILDTLQIPSGKYLLQSAAGSAFGRMLISLAKVTSCADCRSYLGREMWSGDLLWPYGH